MLRAAIHQADVTAQTIAPITVFNPAPGGGTSNTVNFVVYDPSALNPVPTVTSVTPSIITRDQDVTIMCPWVSDTVVNAFLVVHGETTDEERIFTAEQLERYWNGQK